MSRRSRRQFLEDSMFAAAAAAMAGPATSAWSQDEPRVKSASERLNVAVAGVNGRGGSHVGFFSGRPDNKETIITTVVDVDRVVGNKKADQIEKQQNGVRPKVVEDVRQALDDKSIDIITIATPNHWHSLMAIWAMQAGKHVYVEKPASHNISEGRRMVEAARKYNRICQTGTQSRSQPGTIEAMKFIKDGGIGEVNLARGICFKERMSIGPKGLSRRVLPVRVETDVPTGRLVSRARPAASVRTLISGVLSNVPKRPPYSVGPIEP